jgi:hypothetical protein
MESAHCFLTSVLTFRGFLLPKIVQVLDPPIFLKNEIFHPLNKKKVDALDVAPLIILSAQLGKKKLHRPLILLIKIRFDDP